MVERVARSAAFTGGAEVDAFESEFAAYCGTRHAVGLSSGHGGAGARAARARDRPRRRGDRARRTRSSRPPRRSRWSARRRCSSTSTRRTALVTAELVEPAIGPQTRCVIPVHLYGRTVDLDPIVELARGAGIAVIEDACQAHGAWLGSRRAGSIGDCGAFSFYPAKNLGAWGDGGGLVTDDDRDRRPGAAAALARRASALQPPGPGHDGTPRRAPGRDPAGQAPPARRRQRRPPPRGRRADRRAGGRRAWTRRRRSPPTATTSSTSTSWAATRATSCARTSRSRASATRDPLPRARSTARRPTPPPASARARCPSPSGSPSRICSLPMHPSLTRRGDRPRRRRGALVRGGRRGALARAA